MSEPLNPCPFCNTTPVLQHTRETGFYIHCPTCQSYTHGVQWSEAEALAVWNNRPSPWVRIDPERPESLPPASMKKDFLLITVVYNAGTGDEFITTYKALFNGEVFFTYPGKIKLDIDEVYAHMPYPKPAVYPNEEG